MKPIQYNGIIYLPIECKADDLLPGDIFRKLNGGPMLVVYKISTNEVVGKRLIGDGTIRFSINHPVLKMN